MGNIFGGSSSNKTPATPTAGLQIPAFTSSGGVTPEQHGLAEFSLGQDLLGQASAFGSSGTGESTMATHAGEGARMTEAQQLGQMSDVDQTAHYDVYQNDVQNQLATLQNISTLEQIDNPNQPNTSLSSLASAAGGLLGSGGLSNLFGSGSSGSFSSDLQTGIDALGNTGF